ncbi:hypothetical protein BV25DRAFT_1887263 [Artomyces pyxidatus]|uniref:Uncharacterized protein n=1 Tax=Artomyces pyxidatus TaxID=48021 RepID=A0ACB8SZF2_9AGAM|nr:hypothetical protein BV25DRAFT_1887263 [Artomyces pyxidatus]
MQRTTLPMASSALLRSLPRSSGVAIAWQVRRALIQHRALHALRPSTSYPRALSTAAQPISTADTASLETSTTLNKDAQFTDSTVLYAGPLTQTFRRLKIFSLSSLTLSFAVSPFLFVLQSSLPLSARAALAVTALSTSGISTALVAWCGKPYVTSLRRLPPSAPSPDATHSHNDNTPAGIELVTLTLALRPLLTRIYDPVFLADTTRPFARWELASAVQLPPEDAADVQPGTEETVAETLTENGDVIGRWIVRWGENGEGSCRAEGQVIRYGGRPPSRLRQSH